MSYDFTSVERKWQALWEERGDHRAPARPERKYYALEMFAYPSGDIHMGHFRNYTVGDVVARVRRMQGYQVLHPFGWDAFGLPAEEAAIKRGQHPRAWTLDNIQVSRATLQRCGISYDWSREVTTCLPDYYRWSQWLFLMLYRRGLAYRGVSLVNWCPGCKTVLANEQVEDGACWRCHSEVGKRELEQWFLRTTAYADRLLAGLDRLPEWPEPIKTMQRHWIGRSEGATVKFRTPTPKHEFEVFTTRPDTLHGVTFLALAPEHPWARMLAAGTDRERAVTDYIETAIRRSDIERGATNHAKDGVDTGVRVVHPLTGEPIPVWVADYVLGGYGTGVVMGVPAHDERDFAFARRYGLPVKVVIRPEGAAAAPDPATMAEAYTGPGRMVNSGRFDGITDEQGRVKIPTYLHNKGLGGPRVTYRLRDWLISRQRYWGTPIPMVRCSECGYQPVPEKDLPVLLPEGVTEFVPKGRSPLADVPSFMATACPKCGGPAERDADTMDTFICSSWYHLRYASPGDATAPFDREAAKAWLPVDMYIGGSTHATGHLIYFRFLTMVLHDEGLLDFEEPATRLFNHGMVADAQGRTMSKSLGNVVSPIDMIERYGVDATRIAMLFFAPSGDPIQWREDGVAGAGRFLRRCEETLRALGAGALVAGPANPVERSGVPKEVREARRLCHGALRNLGRAVESDLAFNTVVSDLMKALSALEAVRHAAGGPGWLPNDGATQRWVADAVRAFLATLAPLAPHLAEELHEDLGGAGSVFAAGMPESDPEATAVDEVEIAVQVLGKVRARTTVPAGASNEAHEAAARAAAAGHLEGRQVVRVIVVPGRLVNFIVK
jgi:leucyl-tRNA synthetase